MTDTNDLIDQLVMRATPVNRLASPLRRSMAWLALAAVILVTVIAIHGLRPELMQVLLQRSGSARVA